MADVNPVNLYKAGFKLRVHEHANAVYFELDDMATMLDFNLDDFVYTDSTMKERIKDFLKSKGL